MSRLSLLALVTSAALLGACTTAPPGDFAAADPFENTNRAIFDFNTTLDRNVLEPVAIGYGYVTPTLIQHFVTNISNHTENVGTMINFALQGEVKPFARALGRLTLNTILGAGGLLDPATEFGLPREYTDFGVTLGKWGVGEGVYLMLPFAGPFTGRDLVGSVGDRAFDPATYIGPFTALDGLSPTARFVELVHKRHVNADLVADLYQSPDPYITLRSVYLQRRRALVAGDDGADEIPDIFDGTN